METIAHDYQAYVNKCEESSNFKLEEEEYEVVKEVVKGFQYKEISDILSKEFWHLNNLKKKIYKKLGINNSVELVWYMWFVNAKRNFDIEEIRKHGAELFYGDLPLAA